MQHQAYINASVDIRIPTEVESVNYNQIDKEKIEFGGLFI